MLSQVNALLRCLYRAADVRHGAPRAASSRAPTQIEEIEPRILHSADFVPGVLSEPAQTLVEMRIVDPVSAPAIQSGDAQERRTHELIIVDSATPDYQQLIQDIASQSHINRALEVLLIQRSDDAIQQITEALSGLRDIDAIHIISHGRDGAIQLGSGVLDLNAVQQRAAQIQGWSSALAERADLLIYGCDVAQSPDGRLLIDALAQLTGADVAASENVTGNASRAGDWVLEYHAGSVESLVAISGGAQQAWLGILANSAPVLTGANNLASITEDNGTNGGTLVSTLIAGQISDPDAGALSGIAVTAVNNTDGVWQYSTNGGGAWNNFGAPSAASARLLAADANTYVRFVPNANWNGTVSNGFTFRAWDQTSGAAGGTADTTTATPAVRDNFGSVSYTNNDGTATWSAGWVDTDGNPSGGNITISGGKLVLATLLGSDSIYREANLSGATSATLSFSYDSNLVGLLGINLGTATLQISNNGGASYATLASYSNLSGSGTFSTDISAYIASNTRVKLIMDGLLLGGSFEVDNLQIAYVTPLNGGITAFSSATASSSVAVTAVNDAPVGSDTTVVTNEDTPYVLNAAAFGFTDPDDTPVNNLFAVKIATLPAAGSLTLSGAAVSAGQFISLADITAGNLVFTPAAQANGVGYTSFTFQVQDDGGTANGGVDLDASANTVTINVTAVNDAPAGTNKTVSTNEDIDYTFSAADFGFTDPNDSPANALSAVKITTLPGVAGLKLSGVAVTAGQTVALADINAGNLKFSPATNANGAGYASLTFQVQDDGGTANGGVDLDASANTITIDVTSVNDAPAGSNNTVVTAEDTGYVFNVAAFGFTDANDTPANGLRAVKIATLPSAGALTLSGAAVSAGQFIDAADITAGRLVFTPAAHANGVGYASFTFQVQDDGGGTDLDSVARTMTLDVTPVNDAPAGSNNTVVTAEDTAFVFNAAAFGFSDANDTPANSLLAVRLTTLPAAGALTLSGAAVAANQVVSLADINAGNLVFTPGANANAAGYASFTFQVRDDGGGADLDTTPRTMTIDVDAPLHGPTVGANDTGIVVPPSVPKSETLVTRVLAGPSTAGLTEGLPQASSAATATEPQPDAVGATVTHSGFSQVSVQQLDTYLASRDYRETLTTLLRDPRVLLLTDDQPQEAAIRLVSHQGISASTAFGDTETREMLNELDQMRESLREQSRVAASTVAISAAASLGLSVGYVVWLLRGGVLLSSLLSSLPAWRFVDPLPILGRLDDEDEVSDGSDESLETIASENNRQTQSDPLAAPTAVNSSAS